MGLTLCSVVSICFSNRSIVNIAKVEGDLAYKEMMRTRDSLSDFDLGYERFQAPLGLHSLQDYLPPWLGRIKPQDRSLFGMLSALKTATESFLDTSISDADIVAPFPISQSFLDAICAACCSLSLKSPLPKRRPGGILATRLHGIGQKCILDGSEQPILTIDYSRAALTALLVDVNCGAFEYRRVLHDTSLGADALSQWPSSSRSNLARALHDIIRAEYDNGTEITQIGELVIIGEAAGDSRLEDVLKEVMGE